VENLLNAFKDRFGSIDGCQIAIAPGRVNLIGEHTDYNDGFVVPMTIDRKIRLCFKPNHTRQCRIYSITQASEGTFSLDGLCLESNGSWMRYPKAVAWVMEKNSHLNGFDGVIDGDIPMGAGLSSSAAFEVAVTMAFNAVSGLEMANWDIAKLCQQAENEYVGVKCGIMDQFASVFGKANSALLLDCRSLEHEVVPFGETAALDVVICNTRVHHELASSEYNTRRMECENAVKILKEIKPEATHLRDFTVEDLGEAATRLKDPEKKRARHVITENQRVMDTMDAFKQNDLETVRAMMRASHESLRDDYEVTCPELDVLAKLAWDAPGCVGARMTGGGFGGCTVNLVRTGMRGDFLKHMQAGYLHKMNRDLESYTCTITDGARLETLL